MSELVEMIQCKQCGQLKPASRYTPGWCEDCEKAYNNRYSYIRMQNEGWMDLAKDADIELWDRQPQETQLEWSIWQAYRDSYPGAKPSYRVVAEKIGTTYDFVKKTARRWDFAIRMEAWISECDRMTVAQRRQEVLDMNADHIDMARRLRDKLSQAIDLVDPRQLKPSDLNSLLKTATDLEKRAHLDSIVQDEAKHAATALTIIGEDNADLKVSETKKDDLGAVLSILMQAGALGDVTHIGVRKTETTEVLVKDSMGNEAHHISEGG